MEPEAIASDFFSYLGRIRGPPGRTVTGLSRGPGQPWDRDVSATDLRVATGLPPGVMRLPTHKFARRLRWHLFGAAWGDVF